MSKPETIDMTPSWGEVGLLFFRLATSGEDRALMAGREEFGRAFGMAEALSEMWGDLTPLQRAKAQETIEREAAKVNR